MVYHHFMDKTSDGRAKSFVRVSVWPGNTGPDARAWACMVYSMLQLRSVRLGLKMAEVAELGYSGPDAPLYFYLYGEEAQGLLEGEVGVHTLCRKSPYNPEGRLTYTYCMVTVGSEANPERQVRLYRQHPETYVSDRATGITTHEIDKVLTGYLDFTALEPYSKEAVNG